LADSGVFSEVVPAASGRAFAVSAGETITIAQIEAGQVADVFVFAAPNLDEYLSAHHTRVVCSRLFPRPGEAFTSNRRRPIVTLVEDTSPGVHDMLIAACDPMRYELLGAHDHASCQDNLERALAALQLECPVVPQPVNLFMAVEVDADGGIDFAPSPARAGDHVVLRAERDVIVVVSSCPQDLTSINHGRPKDLGVAVSG
jgi:uncharacterized protein YcgI (DUF1989 family)